MLQTERMLKLTIVGPKSKLAATIQACYALNVYHIVEHRKTPELDLGSPLQHAEQLSEILLKLRGIIAQLNRKPNGKLQHLRRSPSGLTEDAYFRLGQKARALYEQVSAIFAERKQLQEQRDAQQEQQEILSALATLGLDPQDLIGSQRFALLFGTIPSVPTLRSTLQRITTRFEITEHAGIHAHPIAIAVERKKEAEVRQQLSALGFSELDCTAILHIAGTTAIALQECEQRIRELHAQLAALEQKIRTIGDAEEEFLFLNESLLTEELRKAEAPLKFAATKSGFMVTGWIPKARLQETTKVLNQATNQAIHIETAEVHHETEVPVAFRNPRPAQPFQFFLEMFSLPSYHEIDPTTLMLFTFPLFFGIMLGDVGYGLISLVLFLLLKQRLGARAKPLLNIMLYAAVVSILFGFAFGEYLGFEHVSAETGEKLCGIGICLPQHTLELHGESETVADFPRLLNRAHGEMILFGFRMPIVLVLGAIIGLIHLNLGLLLGFINGWYHQGFVHGLMEKAGWFMLEIAVVVLALAALHWNFLGYPIPLWAGGILALVAATLLYLGEGIQGLIELPALFSNTLSYMRLGAVGLASVGLAAVVNEKFFLPMMHAGGISIVFGILIMIIGHTINLLLGLIGPFLHALRLHYVEFFTKFYRGGGVPYTPFGYTGDYAQ